MRFSLPPWLSPPSPPHVHDLCASFHLPSWPLRADTKPICRVCSWKSEAPRILPGTGSRTPSDDWELPGGAGGSPAGGRWDSSPFGKQRHTEVGCWMSDLLPGAPVSHSNAGGWTGSPGPLFLCSHQLTTSPLRDLFCLSWPMTQLLCKEGIVSYSGIRG